jgi:hypothetical protein
MTDERLFEFKEPPDDRRRLTQKKGDEKCSFAFRVASSTFAVWTQKMWKMEKFFFGSEGKQSISQSFDELVGGGNATVEERTESFSSIHKALSAKQSKPA